MMTKPLAPFFFLIAVFACALLIASVPAPETQQWLIEEDGIIESLSALGYFACAGFILIKGRQLLGVLMPYLILAVLFGFRELDFDKRFTSIGLLKSKLYLSNEYPLHEKVIGFVVVALLLYALFGIVKRALPNLLSQLRSLNPAYSYAIIAGALVVASKSIDGLERKLKPFGLHFDAHVYESAEVFEEVMELGIPIAFGLALLCFFKQRQQTQL